MTDSEFIERYGPIVMRYIRDEGEKQESIILKEIDAILESNGKVFNWHHSSQNIRDFVDENFTRNVWVSLNARLDKLDKIRQEFDDVYDILCRHPQVDQKGKAKTAAKK